MRLKFIKTKYIIIKNSFRFLIDFYFLYIKIKHKEKTNKSDLEDDYGADIIYEGISDTKYVSICC